jgi:hypothetical protein
MKIKEKDVGREFNKKWHVVLVAYYADNRDPS